MARQVLDEALNITRWTRIYRNPGSFVELLDKFAEFLVHLHDNNKLTFHPILLLHQVTSTLTESIPQEKELYRVATSLGGIHLIFFSDRGGFSPCSGSHFTKRSRHRGISRKGRPTLNIFAGNLPRGLGTM